VSRVELECEYRRAPLSTVAAVVCSGLCALFTVGAFVRGVDGGPVSGAQPIYAVVAVVLGALAVVAVIVRIVRGHRASRIVLTDTALVLPASIWSRSEIAIDYHDLQEVYRSSWFSQSFINIKHGSGKHMIPISCLPSAEVFEAILSSLKDRVAADQTGEQR